MKSFNAPKHIAFIMDGNRRWAKSRGLPTIEGHRKAVQNVTKIVEVSDKIGIEYLTFYMFSSENWYRSAEEVKGLMSLFEFYIKKESNKLLEKNAKVTFIGNLSKLPSNLQRMVEDLMEKSSKNSGIHVILAVSYGSREEILRAAKEMAIQYKQGSYSLDKIDENLFKRFLYVDVPDPDLLIRSGGEVRISNYLLWQIAYTELYFIEKHWPDFTVEDLEEAILEFQRRERRYGR
ncbi:MAG: di-trans,poly-cis-decaprenylcistransferase [Rickettsiales bacterium]|nr:di-trans,poly-cis-decaprenylcistransferase [Rickettsiales bacterium]